VCASTRPAALTGGGAERRTTAPVAGRWP